MLLASTKFYRKAQDVSDKGLDAKPRVVEVEKRMTGGVDSDEISWKETPNDKGGIMLYTSGTTNRPVSGEHCYPFYN